MASLIISLITAAIAWWNTKDIVTAGVLLLVVQQTFDRIRGEVTTRVEIPGVGVLYVAHKHARDPQAMTNLASLILEGGRLSPAQRKAILARTTPKARRVELED